MQINSDANSAALDFHRLFATLGYPKEILSNMKYTLLRSFSTDRLDLIASTLDHLLAELDSTERLASILKIEIGPGWPPGEYDRGAQEFFRDRFIEGGEKVVGWYGWYAIRRAKVGQLAAAVAAGGFFGPPTETGIVEIGYSVVESFRRQGYATEFVKALVGIALSNPSVHRVVARTTFTNHASTSVLERVGFLQSDSTDSEGHVRYELSRESTLAQQGGCR